MNGQPVLVMTVADGHGSDKYDLSQFGSQFATEAAVEVLRKYNPEDKFYYFKKQTFSDKNMTLTALKCDFPNSILKNWREKVREHYMGNIENHAEGDRAGITDNLSNDEKDIFKRYGTTLLVTLVVPAGIFFCQIGDGDIVVIDAEGNIEEPLPNPDELMGNETHSLTSSDSPRLWRITPYTTEKPVLIIMGTDGLSNCFEKEQFHVFCQSLKRNIDEFGLEKVGQTLPDWLDDASQNGSGDDISIAVALINPTDFK